MTCKDCKSAMVSPGYRLFDPLCLHCGARLIQQLGALQIPASECTERRKAVLADWVAQGHSEAEIRRLVKLKTAAYAR